MEMDQMKKQLSRWQSRSVLFCPSMGLHTALSPLSVLGLNLNDVDKNYHSNFILIQLIQAKMLQIKRTQNK